MSIQMRTNSASRIHEIMSRWKTVRAEVPALNGWQVVFGMDPMKGARGYIKTSERVHILVDELDLLRDKLHLRGFSANAYGPAFSKIDSALSPEHFINPSANVKQYLSEDVFAVLTFCSEVLPQEEDGISTEDFASVVGVINELELLLSDNSFPSELTALIRRHVRLAETALANYPLRGAAAIKDAVKAATGDILFSEPEMSGLTNDQRRSLSGLWQSLNNIADKAIKVDNLLQLSGRAVAFLEKLAED